MRGVWRFRRWRMQMREARARRAVSQFPKVRARRPHGLPGSLVVSLTSYPARFSTLALTLRSLLDQTVKSDRVVLWVGATHLEALPDDVRALQAHGLEIRGCEDIRSYTKLIPSLIAWPDAYIVTADDDIYYPPHWLGGLVDAFDPADPAILCWRGHLAQIDGDGRLSAYGGWPLEADALADQGERSLLFPTGIGGVLYPPYSLPAEALDSATFLRLCPYADDLWFFWMAERKGTPHRRVTGRFIQIPWEGSQEAGLLVTNLIGGGNDRQIRALEAELGLVAGQAWTPVSFPPR